MGRGCAAVPPAVHAGNYRVSHAAVLAGWNSSAVLPRQLRSPPRSQQIGHTRNDGADLHYGAVAHLCGLLPGWVGCYCGRASAHCTASARCTELSAVTQELNSDCWYIRNVSATTVNYGLYRLVLAAETIVA
jgi:hypothetical protein